MRIPSLNTVLITLWKVFILVPCLVCLGAIFYELQAMPNIGEHRTILRYVGRLGPLILFTMIMVYKTVQALVSTARRQETEGHFRDLVMKLSFGYSLFGVFSLIFSPLFGLFLIGTGVVIFLIPETVTRP